MAGGAGAGAVAALLVLLCAAVCEGAAGEGQGEREAESERQRQPHIIFIIADDLGWNDVGFHGSNQIPTPNIDALAYDGIILNNYYVSAICTPSRSALMTGKHPIHTGMQHTVLFGAEPRGLPLSEKLLPEYLKDLGYATHIVGKWHLGNYKQDYLPTKRGFDSHLGFWTGHHDYFDHTAVESTYWGLDMRRGLETAWDLHGQYSTDIFTAESERLISSHNASTPLFLYLAHAAVHSGNPYNPLPVSDADVARVQHIHDYNRRKYAAIVQKLDDSVGKVVRALSSAGMLDNSIIVFTTDNGGPAEGFNSNAASNWPLRGVKNTLWEGGVRGAGLIWSKNLIEYPRRVASQLFHITDWLPTLYTAAGGHSEDLSHLDGMDAWRALSQDMVSNRTQVLHNIDDIYGNAALTVGEWKIMKGSTYSGAWDGWYGPSGRDSIHYDATQVSRSMAGRALARLAESPTPDEISAMRRDADVQCATSEEDAMLLAGSVECKPLRAPCLFNIKADPCEKHNLAAKYPDILLHMEDSLHMWNLTAVPPSNVDWDPRGDPKRWDHTWTNFGDYSLLTNSVS